MKKRFLGILVVTLMLLFFGVQSIFAGGSNVLKASCFFTKDHPLAWGVFTWIDHINKAFEGKVKVNYIGGPEVVPVLEQIEAVKKGIIDVSFTSGSHYGPQQPVGYTFPLSTLMPWEERNSGYYDLVVEEHKKNGVRYLGRWLYAGFYFWLKEPASSLDDLKGRRLRTFTTYERLYKALGISGVGIKPAETYTALERGVVEGTMWPLAGPREQGWIRFLKYFINQPLWEKSNLVILMNLDTWKKLSDDEKTKLEEVTASFEREMVAHFQAAERAEYDLLMKEGIQAIELSPSDNQRLLKLSYDVEWAELEKKIPDLVPQLKKALGQ
jgi:TRAP-type C4-dicarboxylate transport system substrate-binding protein